MTRTALAADEPDPPRFATGGIATGMPYVVGEEGCTLVIPPNTAAYPAGNVSVTFEPTSADTVRWLRDRLREPYRTTAWVGKPREIEA